MARTRLGIGGVGRAYLLIKSIILGGKRTMTAVDNNLVVTASNNSLSVTYTDNSLTVGLNL